MPFGLREIYGFTRQIARHASSSTLVWAGRARSVTTCLRDLCTTLHSWRPSTSSRFSTPVNRTVSPCKSGRHESGTMVADSFERRPESWSPKRLIRSLDYMTPNHALLSPRDLGQFCSCGPRVVQDSSADQDDLRYRSTLHSLISRIQRTALCRVDVTKGTRLHHGRRRLEFVQRVSQDRPHMSQSKLD